MAGYAWPVSLPQYPEQASWEFLPRPNVDGFDPEVGMPMTARRTTAAGDDVTVSFMMTRDQLLTFRDFYSNTIIGGVHGIDFTDPVELVTYTWRLAPGSPPRERALSGNLYRVTMQWIRES